ncbi:MAG TPA: winged helix-turn-helix domain-containing protein, partial [Thermoanaerobaculia bacterium]
MAVVRFDCYELDVVAGQLRRRGTKLRLRDQPLQVLATLVGRAGEVVTREELQRLLWPNDVDVDFENNLNTAIGRLREALRDSAKHPRFIETLPRRGYRFIGKVIAEPAARPKIRVVVLPFVNSSGDPAEEYFSDAMTGEVIAELSSAVQGRVAVLARATSMHYKGSPKDVARIARELSVAYVVEGSTRRIGRSVALTVELTRAADQTEIFAKRWEVDSEAIFDLQRTA